MCSNEEGWGNINILDDDISALYKACVIQSTTKDHMLIIPNEFIDNETLRSEKYPDLTEKDIEVFTCTNEKYYFVSVYKFFYNSLEFPDQNDFNSQDAYLDAVVDSLESSAIKLQDMMNQSPLIKENRENEGLRMINIIIESEVLEETDYELLTKLFDKLNQNNTITTNPQQLALNYKTWKQTKDYQLSILKKRVDKIKYVQKSLSKFEKTELYCSPITYDRMTIVIYPRIKDNQNGNLRRIVPDDGFEIFNNAHVSVPVPCITFTDVSGTRTKFYNTPNVNIKQNFKNLVIPPNNNYESGQIICRMWTRVEIDDEEIEVNESPIDSFVDIYIDLKQNYFLIEIKIERSSSDVEKELSEIKNRILGRLSVTFPTVSFDNNEIAQLRGEYNIWDFDIDETSFLHMIMNEEIMSNFLYIEETNEPYQFKSGLHVFFHSMYHRELILDRYACINTKLILKRADLINNEYKQIYNFSDGTIITKQFDPNKKVVPYVYFEIKGRNNEEIQLFYHIFKLLMCYYLHNQKKTLSYIYSYVPSAKSLKSKLKKTTQRKKKEDDYGRLLRLKTAAPDVFVKQYPRRCQKAYQPDIVSDEEAKILKKNKKTVLRFPGKNGTNYNFYCPSKEIPSIGVKANFDLSNHEDYPWIPCCSVDKPSEGNLKKFKNGELPERKCNQSRSSPGKTSKYLCSESVALVPLITEELLKNTGFDNLLRYGITLSKNSLIHCVLTAVHDKNYLKSSKKNEYVKKVRNYIRSKVFPGLLKQELYDRTDEEIMKSLEEEEFFDSLVFYRTLEEIYNINIFVFVMKRGEVQGGLEIPRFDSFHIHSKRNRKTVLVLKNYGSESNALTYPQYELIVSKSKKKIVTTFGEEISDRCLNIINSLVKYEMWRISSDPEMYQNIYNKINHLQSINFQPVGQWIDNLGKARIFNFFGDFYFTLVTLPSQPENLPMINLQTDIYHAKGEDIIKIFGTPNSVYRSDNKIKGFWYNILGLTDAEYIPVIMEDTLDLPDNQISPLVIQVKHEGDAHRLARLKKTLSILIQLLKWVYHVGRSTTNYYKPDNMFRYFEVLENEPEDTSTIYDFSNVPRVLPIKNTVNSAIKFLEEVAPSFCKNKKIIMYNENFLNKIKNVLIDYHNTQIDTKFEAKEYYIKGFYEYGSDFNIQPHTKLFMNTEELSNWYNNVQFGIKSNYNVIKKFVDPKVMPFQIEPYMIEDNLGKIYIVQNTPYYDSKSLDHALSIANYWYNYNVNIGFNYVKTDRDAYILYGIGDNGVITVIEDHSAGSENFLTILYYGTPFQKESTKEGIYAALLEIH